MQNEKRVLQIVRHLEECLAHLDLLMDEADITRVFVHNILAEAREEFSKQLDRLSKLGEIFSKE